MPEVGGDKADAIDRVAEMGELSFEEPEIASFTEDLEFHGYRLSVRPGAVVDLAITRQGTSRKLDTTLFVFGPARDGRFGGEALAFDDDDGWGAQSRLSALALDEGGEYLVVVGTHDGRGRGNYRLEATCGSEDCEPAPAGCHPYVANRILACVDVQVADATADPEGPPPSRRDALEICSDGEALGPMFDQLCMDPSLPFCAAGFDVFAQTMGPACRDELAPFAVECVFGEQYRDVFRSHDIVVGHREVLTVNSPLPDIRRAQIVAAVASSAHRDVTTIEDAWTRPDGGEINRTELWDRTTGTAYVAYEFGAGDTSVGAFFEFGSAQPVAVISDGFVEWCSAARGPQGGDCSHDSDCSVGTCEGLAESAGVGRCTETAGFAEGAGCAGDDACDLGAGLVCAGSLDGSEGLCGPAWMRGVFGEPALAVEVPDGDAEGLARSVTVYGLATVDTDVELDVFVVHPSAGQLRVTLTNPAGNEVTVFEGSGEVSSLDLSGPVSGFSGDEGVNGTWTLRIIDEVSGEAGVLTDWRLRVGSRWD